MQESFCIGRRDQKRLGGHHSSYDGETSPLEHQKPYPGVRKSKENSHRATYRKSVTIDDMMNYKRDDGEDIGVYSDAYKRASWLYINKRDEYRIWIQRQMIQDISPASNSSSDHS